MKKITSTKIKQFAIWTFIIVAIAGCNVRHEALYTQHILDIAGEKNTGKFICPKGKLFRFAIGSPGEITEAIIGAIFVLHNKKIIYSSSFKLNELQKCNWLEESNDLKGRIFDWPNTLDKKLTPKENYEIEIKFNIVPEKSSLWIAYVKLWVVE